MSDEHCLCLMSGFAWTSCVVNGKSAWLAVSVCMMTFLVSMICVTHGWPLMTSPNVQAMPVPIHASERSGEFLPSMFYVQALMPMHVAERFRWWSLPCNSSIACQHTHYQFHVLKYAPPSSRRSRFRINWSLFYFAQRIWKWRIDLFHKIENLHRFVELNAATMRICTEVLSVLSLLWTCICFFGTVATFAAVCWSRQSDIHMAIGMVCDFLRALLVHCIAHVAPLLECWQTYVAPLLECWKTVVVPTLSCLHNSFKQLWASICLGWGSIFFLLPFCLLNCTQRRFTNWGRLARVLVLQYFCSWLPTVKFDSIGIPISFSTIMHIVVLIFTIFADDYRKQGMLVCIGTKQ